MSNIHGLGNGGGGGGGGPQYGGGGLMGGMGGMGGGGSDQSCGDMMKNAWNGVPWFCKKLTMLSVVFYLLTFVAPLALMLPLSIPGIKTFFLWTLFTGEFVHPQLLMLLFAMLSYIPSACMAENEMGTVPFALRFFINCTFINILYTGLGIGLSMGGYGVGALMGLWPIMFCDLVIQCYQYPEMPRGLCCCPINIKSKYYPLVLIAIFMIFFGPDLSMLLGLATGYLWVFGQLKFLEPKMATINQWASRWPFKDAKEAPDFKESAVHASDNGAGNSGSPFGNMFNGGGNASSTATEAPGQGDAQQEKKKETKAFSGKGTALGSDIESRSLFGLRAKLTDSKESEPVQQMSSQDRAKRNQSLMDQIRKQREERQGVAEIHEEAPGDEQKKSDDDLGNYKPVASNENNKYLM